MDTSLKIIENYISQNVCDLYLKYLMKNNLWETNPKGANLSSDYDKSSWNNRIINFYTNTEEMKTNLASLRSSIIHEIKKSNDVTQELYPNIFQFVKLGVGDYLYPHRDSVYPDDTPHKNWFFVDYSSVLYLNDDFDGGEIYFPDRNLELKIKKGMLVHYSSLTHHGVRQVKQGHRYTLTGFYTKNIKYSEKMWEETT
jgi:predicted 2-oxoglutarate/Fe(II)-dependent dioxygenase YbiX